MPALQPTWLLAAVPEGLLLLGRDTEIEVELDAPDLEALAELLATGAGADAIAGRAALEPDDARDLVAQLSTAGALAEEGAPEPSRMPLAEAVLTAYADEPVARLVWTADELLVVPGGLRGRALRRALRAFISGFASHLRLRAYARLALVRRRTVWGDLPEPAAAAAASERAGGLDPARVHVIDLRDGALATVAPDGLDGIGAHAAHRLGPVASSSAARGVGAEPVFLGAARYAQPNLRFPGLRHSRSSGFGTSAEEAELIARAEAVERYATGDAAAHELRRARASELEGAVPPDLLCRYNERQYEQRFAEERYDPGDRLLWLRATGLDGSPRWIAAETVFTPFADPGRSGRLPPATSSGVAAHPDPAEARWRALAELVERDAFMWTWVQRVSRERFSRKGLDDRTAALVAEVERRGFAVEFVNLTLDTWPVVLCAVHDDSSLRISAACRPEASLAAGKCLLEAAAGVLWSLDDGPAALAPEDVRTPEDHLRLYADPSLLDAAGFLLSSGQRIEFGDVPAADAPIEQRARVIGEPVVIDLSSPATEPFRALRVALPGIVPISFGYDREPFGLTRLGSPIATLDGRQLGQTLELDRAGPIIPHPFP